VSSEAGDETAQTISIRTRPFYEDARDVDQGVDATKDKLWKIL
jgi:hypothetical protein